MYYTSKEVYEYISTQTNDPIVEWKTCRVSGKEFAIYKSDLEFYKKVSPSFGWKTFSIPTPTLCPEERQRRRLLFRNERKIYKRLCDATGETIVSIYSPNKKQTVYGYKFWLSDARDPSSYGQDFHAWTSFTEQFSGLLETVPSKSLVSEYNENCEYTSICGYCKNCYLTTASEYTENSLYSHLLQNCKEVLDSSFVYDSEHCYECIDIQKCFHCFYLSNSENCSFCYHSYGLKNCAHCIECSNLVNQSYCIQNKQVSKEVFESYQQTHHTSLNTAINILPWTYQLTTSSCFWSFISNASEVFLSYEVENAKHIKYSQIIVWGTDLMDCSNCYIDGELSYEIMSALSTKQNVLSAFIYNCSHCLYTMNCNDSHHLFGCSNLRNKQYCIFNKQYTQEEYEQLVPKIITHMQETPMWSGQTSERGEFFDPSLSPFGYNETVAQEYFPLTKETALSKGYKWQDNSYDPVIPADAKTLKWDQIPTDPQNVTDDILKSIFMCEISWRPFRLIKQELDFYRKHNLPLPRKHPDIRHQERLTQRPPRELHLTTCDKCAKEMVSVYSTNNSGQKVYCQSCYQKEVYN